MAVTSLGIKLGYKTTSSATSYTNLVGLQDIPDLSKTPNTIDVTTLADSVKHYEFGVRDLGSLEFTFLYDGASGSSYNILDGLKGQEVWFQIEFPDIITASTGHGSQFEFSGKVSVGTSGVGVDGAVQFKLAVALTSDIAFVAPV